MKKLMYLLIIVSAFSCKKDDDPVCVVKFAEDESSQEYVYTHEGTNLTKVQVRDKGTIDFTLEYTFEYDEKGRVSLKSTTDVSSGNRIDQYFTYEGTAIFIHEYVVNGADTLGEFEYYQFYVEKPADKIYHDQHSSQSYKFSAGNLIQSGTYTVSGSDTTATFNTYFTYDSNPNFSQKTDYNVILSSDYLAARRSSKNNFVIAEDVNGAWKKEYIYNVDNSKRLIGYISSTGDGALFEYECR